MVNLNLNQRSEPSTPATPRSRSDCATPAPMEVDEENVPPHSAAGRAVVEAELRRPLVRALDECRATMLRREQRQRAAAGKAGTT